VVPIFGLFKNVVWLFAFHWPMRADLLRAKDPKVRRAWVCMTVAGLVLQGITGG